MTREDIMKELEKVQDAMFMASMADFMDWANYYTLRDKERELKELLGDQNNGEEIYLCSSV